PFRRGPAPASTFLVCDYRCRGNYCAAALDLRQDRTSGYSLSRSSKCGNGEQELTQSHPVAFHPSVNFAQPQSPIKLPVLMPSKIFSREDVAATPGQVILWWEARRVPYNMAVGLVGFLSVAVLLAVGPHLAHLDEPLFSPFFLFGGYFFME